MLIARSGQALVCGSSLRYIFTARYLFFIYFEKAVASFCTTKPKKDVVHDHQVTIDTIDLIVSQLYQLMIERSVIERTYMPRNKSKSEQMRTESRQQILATAQRLFAELGYDGCNVSDIASQAGMSQGNIYWYFSSKEELFKAVLAEGFNTLGNAMAEAAARPGTSIEKFDFFLERFNTFMKDEGGDEFSSIVITLLAGGGMRRLEKLGHSTQEIGAGYHHSLNAIFAQGQEEGAITPDIAPNLLSTFFFSFVNGLMIMYPDEWKDIPYEVIREAAVRLLGISAQRSLLLT
jgi:AcrR family transcriptional regulator